MILPLPAVAVLLGFLMLAASLFLSLRARAEVPVEMRRRWLLLGGLMAFFLVGYLAFFVIQVRRIVFPLEELTAAVFSGGALFVLIATRLTLRTLHQINVQRSRLSDANAQLLASNTILAEEIDRRQEAEATAVSRLRYLTSLHNIDTILSSSLDLRVTLKLFLDQLMPQLGIDAAAVLLLNRYTQTLEFASGHGFHTKAIEGSRERLGEGSAGTAAMERAMCHIPLLSDQGGRFQRREQLRDEGFISYCAQPLIAKGEVKGVLEVYHRKAFEPDPEWTDFLESLAVRAAIAIENATLFNDLQRSNAELIIAYDSTIEGWGRALELRDSETSGHTERVAAMTCDMARGFGIGEEKIVHIHRGALLHDIGKMAISDAILMKEGAYSDEERRIMQEHPQHAFRMLAPISYLQPALDIPYCHHERWDGTGYPRGLKGAQIPLAARIFAVADTYDALINERRYHEAWSRDRVCSYIRDQAGSHFDPEVVDRFLRMQWCREKECLLPGKGGGNVRKGEGEAAG
ncbi:MAG: HD domain-containing phosphohydrolase [Thermodesulfobacteriota bacterium]